MRVVYGILIAIVAVAAAVVAYGYLREPLRHELASWQLQRRGGTRLVFEPLQAGDLDRTAKILARRVEYATGEPAFASVEKGKTIVVDVVSAPKIAIERLARRALLEFRAVDDDDHTLESLPLPPGVTLHWEVYAGKERQPRRVAFLVAVDRQALLELLRAHPVAGREWLLGPQADAWRSYLAGPARLTSANVATVALQIDHETQRPYVWVRFDDAGKRELARLTREIEGGRLGIALDGEMLAAPVVQEQLSTGVAAIALGGLAPPREAMRDARQLELTLQSGELPVPVRYAGSRPLRR
jgi:preprotein translocase subunit SecD